MNTIPEVVQVVPFEDYTVSVYFSDGKIVLYDAKPKLESGVFQVLKNLDIFMGRCVIMNDTLAWDVNDDGNPSECIDIAPDTLYMLPDAAERIA